MLTTSDSLVNNSTAGQQIDPRTAVLSDGGRVVAWQSSGAPGDVGYDVRLQLFGPDGAPAGAEIVVTPGTAGDQTTPMVAATANGFVVAWTDSTGINTDDVYGQMFSAAGDKIGQPFLLNTQTAHAQDLAYVIPLAGGEKKTVLILDKPGGGVRIELL